MKNNLIAQSKIYGKLAFDNNIPCAPVRDENVMSIVASLSTTNWENHTLIMDVFKAWYSGWNNANIEGGK